MYDILVKRIMSCIPLSIFFESAFLSFKTLPTTAEALQHLRAC